MNSFFSRDSGDEPARPAPPMANADALNPICAVPNTTDRGPDTVDEIVRVVRAAGRPYVQDPPVIDVYTSSSRHGLPRADVEVDGEKAVAVWVDDRGPVQVWIASDAAGRDLRADIGGVYPGPCG
jgi:hypothetical protein